MSFSDGGFLSEEESMIGHKRLWNEIKVRRKIKPERIAEAVFRRDEKGETNIQIARAMGMSMATVSNIFQDLLEIGAIQPIKEFWKPEEDEEMETCLEAGMTIAQIATKMGRTYSSIRNRMLVRGLERGASNEQDEFYKKGIASSDAHVAAMTKHHRPQS